MSKEKTQELLSMLKGYTEILKNLAKDGNKHGGVKMERNEMDLDEFGEALLDWAEQEVVHETTN